MNLQLKSIALRRRILDIVYTSGAGHIGGDFSVVDILNVLYNSQMNVSPENYLDPCRDRFILSKGHAAEALYAVLCDCGFFPESDLQTVSQFGSRYIGHPTDKVPGIEMNGGSLGHGLAVANGMALAAKADGVAYHVYTVMGDGELAEGSVWEAAMLAAHYKLDNLTAIIDRNRLQISGFTEDVMQQENLAARWSSFGWNVLMSNGNDVGALDRVLTQARSYEGAPTVIIANTVKGCGVSFMEGSAAWHHRIPVSEEYAQALAELEQMEQEARANE